MYFSLEITTLKKIHCTFMFICLYTPTYFTGLFLPNFPLMFYNQHECKIELDCFILYVVDRTQFYLQCPLSNCFIFKLHSQMLPR